MSTLTEIAYYTRKGIVWLIVSIIAFFILRFLFFLILPLLKPPPPPPKPTVGFGKLTGLVFEEKENIPSLTYILQTKEGTLPQATSSARVYFIPQQLPGLLAAERAKKFAAEMGFITEPEEQTPTILQFSDPDYPLTLILDTVTKNFTLTYDFIKDPTVMGTPPLDPQRAIDQSVDFFRRLNIFPQNIDEELTTTQLLRLVNNELVTAISLATTQAIRVDFFFKDYLGLPMVTPQFVKSPIYTIYTGNKEKKKQFIEIGFNYFPVDTDTSETYPLKTTQQAWEELTQGKGFIAHLPPKIGNEVIIRRVYLAYYQSSQYQPYLQPIFVFEGDDKFAAYVPAITSDWTEPAQKVPPK